MFGAGQARARRRVPVPPGSGLHRYLSTPRIRQVESTKRLVWCRTAAAGVEHGGQRLLRRARRV